MPKALDLRIQGMSFEDAVKKMIAAPPSRTSTKSKRKKDVKKPAKPKRKKK